MIDLRSDTVTRPTPEMRAVMAAAEVGDDVYDDDPTVHRLQDRLAKLLGAEAALFVPSGTMANQICVRVHTQPSDELICETTSHIYVWEAGGPAALSGVTTRTVDGDCGVIDVEQLKGLIRPASEHCVRARLVTLENTHNRGGGRVYPLDRIEAISAWAHANGLSMHLDGARIWNAHIATGLPLARLCKPFDSVSVCFSKGLGSRSARRWQARKNSSPEPGESESFMADTCGRSVSWRRPRFMPWTIIYSDSSTITVMPRSWRPQSGICLGCGSIPIAWTPTSFGSMLTRPWRRAPSIADRFREQGVLVHVAGPRTLRICTHLDVSAVQAAKAADLIRVLCR